MCNLAEELTTEAKVPTEKNDVWYSKFWVLIMLCKQLNNNFFKLRASVLFRMVSSCQQMPNIFISTLLDMS